MDLGRLRGSVSGLIRPIGLFSRSREPDHDTRSPATLVSFHGVFPFRRLVYGTNTPRHALCFPACSSSFWSGSVHFEVGLAFLTLRSSTAAASWFEKEVFSFLRLFLSLPRLSTRFWISLSRRFRRKVLHAKSNPKKPRPGFTGLAWSYYRMTVFVRQGCATAAHFEFYGRSSCLFFYHGRGGEETCFLRLRRVALFRLDSISTRLDFISSLGPWFLDWQRSRLFSHRHKSFD